MKPSQDRFYCLELSPCEDLGNRFPYHEGQTIILDRNKCPEWRGFLYIMKVQVSRGALLLILANKLL